MEEWYLKKSKVTTIQKIELTTAAVLSAWAAKMQTPIMKKLRSCNTRFCQKSSKRLTSMAILLATLVTLNSEAT